MVRLLFIVCLTLASALGATGTALAQPSQTDVMIALDAAMQRIEGYDGTKVTTFFQAVRPGAPNGGSYPFRVSMIVHTSEEGYPSNGYYGESCTETFNNIDFEISADGYGGWQANGPMSAYNKRCTPNPDEYTLGVPLETISGQTVDGLTGTRSSGASGGALSTGDWSCWSSSSLVASINLRSDGYYTDTGGNYGTYEADIGRGEIYFSGAALDGIVGTDLRGQSFRIGSNVICEP